MDNCPLLNDLAVLRQQARESGFSHEIREFFLEWIDKVEHAEKPEDIPGYQSDVEELERMFNL